LAASRPRIAYRLQARRLKAIAASVGLLLAAGSGFGLGFGRPQATAVLGSPLAFSLPLQVPPGDRFDPDCVQVEVRAGDRPLPAYELRWRVHPGVHAGEHWVQVSTLGVIDEPVLSVRVSSGCAAPVSRLVTLLTQAPGLLAAQAAGVAARLDPLPVAAAGAAPRARAATPLPPAAHASLRLDASPRLDASLRQGLPARPSTGLPAGATLALGVQAAVADLASQLAGDQIKALEQQVQQVLAEARRQQDQVGQLRQRLAAAESASGWLPWLLLGGMAVGALAIWLALRVRRLQRELDRRVWTQAEADRHDALAPEGAPPSSPLMSPDQPLLSQAAMLGATTLPDLTIAQPRRLPPSAPAVTESPPRLHEFSLGTGVPPRPVSVEELLDLDQQVDFFIALGQEQSAVDLLLGHVRSTGGTNALPYFKLLEIYRSQGDEEAYERTRERFNQRFNAYAPDWAGDLAGGRTLEGYPEVVQRLQRAWTHPLRAVAELESLLLRRADLEPFDLPAYREMLMLHALVRDLPAGTLHAATTTVPKLQATAPPASTPALAPRVDEAGDAVDLLLPLDDGPMDITLPRTQVSPRSSAQAMLAEWVFTRATQPRPEARVDLADKAAFAGRLFDEPSRPAALDLDLSELTPAPREFTRPGAFTDIELRRDAHRSDLGALDEGGLAPPLSRR